MNREIAIRVEDLGIRFLIRHLRAPTVGAGIARILERRPRAEEFWALRNVSFDLNAGSVLGIIGPNGSGKSTLLRVLARILSPDEGAVEIRGRVSSLISLGAGFEPTLSGLENIYFNGMLLGLGRHDIERRLEEIIAFADLPGRFIEAPVRTYSSGMRARLGFSVAVHVDPEILVVDEVLTVGDARFRAKCRATFEGLIRKGATVVMVQHNLEVIESLCTEAIWLDGGRLREHGAPTAIIRAYLTSQGIDPGPEKRPPPSADGEQAGTASPPHRAAGGAPSEPRD